MTKLFLMTLCAACCWTAAAAGDYDWIVFTGGAKNQLGLEVRTLERIKSDGSARERIYTPADGTTSAKYPSVSPRGKKIAATLGYNLWIMDWDGSNALNITPWGREKYQPCWTPDGNSLLYCSDLMGDCEIFALNPDGSDNRNLTWSFTSSDMAPTISPDGKSVAFISNRNGRFELFLMGPQRLQPAAAS